jgi:hypothetical protein
MIPQGHLWNSYNSAVVSISKTYVTGGISRPSNKQNRATETHSATGSTQYVCSVTHGMRSGEKVRRSFVMWDLVMLALGLGLFALAVGYSYACERL